MNASIEEYSKNKAFAQALFPNPEQLKFLVEDTTQKKELERLKSSIRYEQFFLIVDMVAFEISHIGGFEALGYNSDSITMRDYFQMIKNDGILQLVSLLGRETFNLSSLDIISFAKPKFIVNLPMKHADGRMLLVKRIISPWQVTADMKISAYLSEFTIIGDYQGEPLNPRIEDVNPAAKEIYDKVVNKMLAVQPTFKNPFSPKEMILLQYYAQNKEASAKQTAQENNIEVSTMHYYNKQILQKAKSFFGEHFGFQTAKDVAEYLKKNGFFRT